MNASFWAGPRLGLAIATAALIAGLAQAQEPCPPRIDRSNVVACVLAASPLLRAEAAQLRAAEGRREAARPILPSNPNVNGSVGTRSIPGNNALNWSVGVAQELEVAGQRGLRLETADAEVAAQSSRLEATRQSLCQAAWESYFGTLAATERSAVRTSIGNAAAEFSATVRAMAAHGLVSEVDGRVAEALALEAAERSLLAEQELRLQRERLTVLIGASALADAVGPLEPLSGIDGAPSVTLPQRAELQASARDITALEHRIALLRRSRAPNPTISIYAQNDGFNERVFGVGLQLPIPLPHPVGFTAAGQIAEHLALAEKATADADRLKRDLQLELIAAGAELETRRRIRSLYTAERTAAAISALAAISREVKAARLAVREAIVSQQALTQLLLADVDAREALALASVRYARAAAIPLEGERR